MKRLYPCYGVYANGGNRLVLMVIIKYTRIFFLCFIFSDSFLILFILILEISETNGTVRIDYLEEGIMYPHGVDIDGKLMFIIRCKLHFKASKDSEECKKCAVYWFERMER